MTDLDELVRLVSMGSNQFGVYGAREARGYAREAELLLNNFIAELRELRARAIVSEAALNALGEALTAATAAGQINIDRKSLATPDERKDLHARQRELARWLGYPVTDTAPQWLDAPTGPGWWWQHESGKTQAVEVRRFSDGRLCVCDHQGVLHLDDGPPCKWLGPLPTPPKPGER